jgi:hypothetical protein
MKVSIGNAQSTAKMARVTESARAIAAELGAAYRVELRMPAAETLHLFWFDGGTRRQPARPILTVTDAMRDDVARVMAARIVTDGRVNKLVALTVGASRLRELWCQRIPNGGDMTLAPLSPSYRAWKARKGLRTGIGEATGAMKHAMQSALIVVSKT